MEKNWSLHSNWKNAYYPSFSLINSDYETSRLVLSRLNRRPTDFSKKSHPFFRKQDRVHVAANSTWNSCDISKNEPLNLDTVIQVHNFRTRLTSSWHLFANSHSLAAGWHFKKRTNPSKSRPWYPANRPILRACSLGSVTIAHGHKALPLCTIALLNKPAENWC